MILSAALAIQEARIKANHDAENAARRRRLADKSVRIPDEERSPTVSAQTDYLKEIGHGPESIIGARFGAPRSSIYRAYRALKILHD